MTSDRRFIEFVHAKRSAVGMALLGLAVGCVVLAAYCGYRGLADKPGTQEPAATVAPPNADGPSDPTPAAGRQELDPAPWQMGLAAALIAALGVGGVGAFFVGKLPPADPDVRRRADRVLVLVAGYVFGLANRVSGLFLFVHWFAKLTDWVNGVAGSNKTGWLPVAALLQYLVGAGVTFLATLPARAEERNRPGIRRAVYAVNFALTTVLLVVGLVVVNVMVALKAPEALDTTSTGFYTLTPQGAEYLRGLKAKVKVSAVTPVGGDNRDQRVLADALRLLSAMREVNPSRFEVEQLSVVYDRTRIEALQQKYPTAGLSTVGLLIATGDDFERHEFLPLRQLIDPERGSFVGEVEVIRTLRALIDKRTTAYFTQASREPVLDRPTAGAPDDPTAAVSTARLATRLKDVLERSQCSARPLPSGPTVPDDADLVVVLDPLDTLPEATVTALRAYMQPAGKDARKGRLVVFAPARSKPGGGAVLETGLEPLLADYGIALLDRVVYSKPSEKKPADWSQVLAEKGAVDVQNPVALATDRGFDARTPRPLIPLNAPGREPVGRGVAGSSRFVLFATGPTLWVEGQLVNPPQKAWADFEAANQRGEPKRSSVQMPVAALAFDTDGKPAAAVFGFGEGLTDDSADGGRGARLLTASLDWLRERPPAPDITPKEYVDYLPKKGVSEHMLFTVPVAGTLLAIVLLGLGVWAVRRK